MHKFRMFAASVTAGLGLACAGLSPIAASQPLYLYTYYSDASLTQAVGSIQEYCVGGQWVASFPIQGQRTPYFTQELIGGCPGDLF
jgi:hypothetical protein